MRDGCQRSGLRGRTSTALGRALMLADGAMDARGRVYGGGPPTALGRTLILSYYKGKIHFPTLPKCKTYAYALCSMGLVAAPLLLWQDERIRAGILL